MKQFTQSIKSPIEKKLIISSIPTPIKNIVSDDYLVPSRDLFTPEGLKKQRGKYGYMESFSEKLKDGKSYTTVQTKGNNGTPKEIGLIDRDGNEYLMGKYHAIRGVNKYGFVEVIQVEPILKQKGKKQKINYRSIYLNIHKNFEEIPYEKQDVSSINQLPNKIRGQGYYKDFQTDYPLFKTKLGNTIWIDPDGNEQGGDEKKYYFAHGFHNGYAVLIDIDIIGLKNSIYTVIDLYGKEILKTTNKIISNVSDGLLVYDNNPNPPSKTLGIMDLKGNCYQEGEYKQIYSFSNGYSLALENKPLTLQWYLLSSNLNEITINNNYNYFEYNFQPTGNDKVFEKGYAVFKDIETKQEICLIPPGSYYPKDIFNINKELDEQMNEKISRIRQAICEENRKEEKIINFGVLKYYLDNDRIQHSYESDKNIDTGINNTNNNLPAEANKELENEKLEALEEEIQNTEQRNKEIEKNKKHFLLNHSSINLHDMIPTLVSSLSALQKGLEKVGLSKKSFTEIYMKNLYQNYPNLTQKEIINELRELNI